jgi:hypothetical protein
MLRHCDDIERHIEQNKTVQLKMQKMHDWMADIKVNLNEDKHVGGMKWTNDRMMLQTPSAGKCYDLLHLFAFPISIPLVRGLHVTLIIRLKVKKISNSSFWT